MMGVAVTGASGRMGKLIIQNVASADDMMLVAVFDVKGIDTDVGGVRISNAKDIRRVLTETKPDVLVDFTIAHAAVENVKSAAECGVNLVVGTTGFTQEQHAEMEGAIDKKVAAVISPNFSVGVNVFWKIITEAARHLSDCDIEIVEAHHRHKKDAPSGTAIKTAKLISKALGRMEIPVHAIRSGDIVGDHTVLYAGDGERVEIKHQAHSRQAFVSGVMRGIRWVVNAKKGIHSMDDVLGVC